MDREYLKKELELDEGLKLNVYADTKGKATIGVGHNLEKGISKKIAMFILDCDVDDAEDDLDRTFTWWRRMSERRQRALANMCFNLGLKKLLEFKKMLPAMERGDFETAANEAIDSDWYKQVKSRGPRIVEMIRKG